MGKYVQTSLDQFINESKAFTLKRKYADKPAVVVGTKAPLRTQVLNYVAENAKVSLGDLKKFIIGLNEGKARPAAASMWIKRNAQFFVMENSNGVSYLKLSNLGKRLAKTGIAPVTTATAPSMADVTNESKVNEGCNCKKPPRKRGRLIERLADDDDDRSFEGPEDDEEDFGIGDSRYGVDRARSIEDEGMAEDIIEPESDEDYIDDNITDEDDELEDDELEDEDDVQSEIDELRSEVEELRAIIDELTGEDEELEDEDELTDEDFEDDEFEDEDELEDDIEAENLEGMEDEDDFRDDSDDDNMEATEFEEDEEIDESADEYEELEDEELEDETPIRDPMKRRRPQPEDNRKFDFKDKGRPGLHDMDESVETPEERVKRVIENIKAKRLAKLNEAEEEKAEDVGSTPPAESDELKDDDLEGDGDVEQTTDGEDTEPTEEKVEITEFVITVDDLEEAMKELEGLGIQAERVPKEAETTEEMPQEVEPPADDAAPAEDDLSLDLGDETEATPEAPAAPAAPVQEAAPAPAPAAPAAPAEDDLDLSLDEPTDPAAGGAAPAAPAVPADPAAAPTETVPATTEFEENKLKVPADQWETLKTWLEEKGVDVVEMFGGEIEVEEEPGTMGADDTEEINFDDIELDDTTKVDKNEDEPEDGKTPEEAPATV